MNTVIQFIMYQKQCNFSAINILEDMQESYKVNAPVKINIIQESLANTNVSARQR